MRYTRKQLSIDIDAINARLANKGIDVIFIVVGRYGYTAIDYCSNAQLETYCINGTVATGTAKECLAKCEAWLGRYMLYNTSKG